MIVYGKYKIKADAYQYVIYKAVIKTNPKTQESHDDEDIVGFYGTMEQVIYGIQKDMMRSKVAEQDMTMTEALEYCKKTWEEIKKELEGKK